MQEMAAPGPLHHPPCSRAGESGMNRAPVRAPSGSGCPGTCFRGGANMHLFKLLR